MRYIPKRRLPTGYRTSAGGKRKKRRVLPALTVILLLWGVISEKGLSSVSPQLTEEAARNYLLLSMNKAVDEELRDRENSFVNVARSSGGEISAVSTDAAALNRLKSGILNRLSKSLNGNVAAWVPIGSFTDVGVFNGRGPKAAVKLNLEGSADVSFQTDFHSAGINQSCHRIIMTVKARAYSQSKRFETQVEEQTVTVLAETVVVGEVPDVAMTLS